eukprot:814753-Heterocapsa_arctica.AAC.1
MGRRGRRPREGAHGRGPCCRPRRLRAGPAWEVPCPRLRPGLCAGAGPPRGQEMAPHLQGGQGRTSRRPPPPGCRGRLGH